LADLTVEELLASREVVLEFWRALGSDDDLSAWRLYYPPSLALDGLTAGKITAEIRAGLSLSIEECRAMAFSATARILPDGDGGDAVAWLATRSTGRIDHPFVSGLAADALGVVPGVSETRILRLVLASGHG